MFLEWTIKTNEQARVEDFSSKAKNEDLTRPKAMGLILNFKKCSENWLKPVGYKLTQISLH